PKLQKFVLGAQVGFEVARVIAGAPHMLDVAQPCCLALDVVIEVRRYAVRLDQPYEVCVRVRRLLCGTVEDGAHPVGHVANGDPAAGGMPDFEGVSSSLIRQESNCVSKC